MSAEIADAGDGVLTVRIAGELTEADLRAVQKEATEILQRQTKMRILILAEGFAGWERGGAWGDFSFQMENDSFIEKMAIVGDQKWEDLAVLFAGKGFRRFPVEYFLSAQLAKARAWLAAPL